MSGPKRKARRCGYCDETGHTIKTCEARKEVAARKRRLAVPQDDGRNR
jgi:hypothetical protein